MRNENCHQDAIKRNIKPKFPPQTTFGTLVMETAQKRRVLVSVLMKTAEMFFQKHALTLDVAMVTNGGRRRLKNKFLF